MLKLELSDLLLNWDLMSSLLFQVTREQNLDLFCVRDKGTKEAAVRTLVTYNTSLYYKIP